MTLSPACCHENIWLCRPPSPAGEVCGQRFVEPAGEGRIEFRQGLEAEQKGDGDRVGPVVGMAFVEAVALDVIRRHLAEVYVRELFD